jgi:polysaccharide export outer membrane protein
MKILNRLCACAAILLAASSCDTSKNVAYLQDIDTNVVDAVDSEHGITIQPKDMLSIVVTSKNPELSAMFNLPTVSYQSGSEITAGESTAQQLMGYVVDEEGFIDFPVIGKIKVSGMNRWELQDKIKNEISGRNLLKDMVVTVEFMNFKISILGEVKTPGSYSIEGDKVTILEAISMAGDLTIYGQRDNVYVIREDGDERTTYKIDLRSTSLFDSPAYYLKQNDIVYVQPNKVRAGQSTINENNMKSVTLWMSIASLLSSIGVLITTIINNNNN